MRALSSAKRRTIPAECVRARSIFSNRPRKGISRLLRTNLPRVPSAIVIGPILDDGSYFANYPAVPFSSHIIRRLSREWNPAGRCQDYVKTERTRALQRTAWIFQREQLAARTARGYADSYNLLDFTSYTHSIIRH
jgi:hypothetical protein